MRLRTFLAWSVLPIVVVAVGSAWFVSRSVDSDRARISRLVATSARSDALQEADGWAISHASTLMALDAFQSIPLELQTYKASADVMRGDLDRSGLLASLATTQTEGATALRRLEALGPVSPQVRRVLSPLPPPALDSLHRGDVAFLDAGPDAAAVDWLQTQMKSAKDGAAVASRKLRALAGGSPFWTDTDFELFAVALLVLVLGAGLMGYRRMSVVARASRAELDAERARSGRLQQTNTDLRSLIGVARRVTAEHGLAPFARTLVAELGELVGGELVSVMLLRDGRLEPFGEAGRLQSSPVALGAGVAGRSAETAAVIRTVVASDPLLPSTEGPLSMLSAPLVSDGRVLGVIVAATRSTEPYADNHEMAFQLVALISATAVQTAERYDSTVALTLDDPLTGLANRRCLEHDLRNLSALGPRAAPVGFVMIDIDHFKAFNDVHGHPEGDAVLRQVARAINGAVRDGDVVYRFGGEEFSVLLRDTDAETAAVVAERIRRSVRLATPPPGAGPITVSVGVTVQPSPPDVDALVVEADGALYEAKRAGRDQVVVTDRSKRVEVETGSS